MCPAASNYGIHTRRGRSKCRRRTNHHHPLPREAICLLPACLHHPRLPPNTSVEYSVFSTSVPCSPGIPAMPAFVFVSPRVESGIHSASYEKRWWGTARKKLSKGGCESVALARARDPSRGAGLVVLEVLCLGMKKTALALLRADIRTLVLPAATSV